MNNQRWAQHAMYEHIKYNSYYYKHIFKLKDELNITEHIPKKYLEKKLNSHFLTRINEHINQHNLPINEIDELELHKQCNENTTIISSFRLKTENTRNYYHTNDNTNDCIPCWMKAINKKNTGHHIFFEFEQMKRFRTENLMTTWINDLKLKGHDEQIIFKRYLDGKNIENENEISMEIIKQRVKYLNDMTEFYNNLW